MTRLNITVKRISWTEIFEWFSAFIEFSEGIIVEKIIQTCYLLCMMLPYNY